MCSELERVKQEGLSLQAVFCNGRDRVGSLAKLGTLLDVEDDFLDALSKLTCVSCAGGVPTEELSEAALEAQEHLTAACQELEKWCAKGAKLVASQTERVKQCIQDLREARELMVFYIDQSFLSHVFSSVFISRFDGICQRLSELQGPNLNGQLGRRATRATMEQHLQEELKRQMLDGMCTSLEAVTAEISKAELPALQKVQSVSRHSVDLPSHDEADALHMSMDRDNLHHFAIHVVLHCALHLALDLIGEVFVDAALGPLGVVLGVAALAVSEVKPANWPSVRAVYVKQLKSRHVEFVSQARDQFDFAELGELRRQKIIAQMDKLKLSFDLELAHLDAVAAQLNEITKTQNVMRLSDSTV